MTEESEETVHQERRSRSRRGIGSYFRRLARAFSRGDRVPADEEQTVAVDPPAEPDLEIEVEREDDQVSLEIEVEWQEDEEGADIETDLVASKATFEVYEDSAGDHRWRLRHQNSNIIADGSEGYASKQKAEQGLESVRENAPGAYVVDTTREEEPDEEGGSDATFEIFRDNADEYRWRLVHDNGNIIADGGQGYSSKQKCKQGLRSVRENVPGAPVEEVED